MLPKAQRKRYFRPLSMSSQRTGPTPSFSFFFFFLTLGEVAFGGSSFPQRVKSIHLLHSMRINAIHRDYKLFQIL